MTLNHPTHGTYVGHDVVDSANHEVGTVTDVIYEADRPAWFVVDLGLLHGERYVPAQRSYTAENGSIVVPYDKHQVKAAKKPARDHVLIAADTEALAAHYELHESSDMAHLADLHELHPTEALGRRVKRYLLLADGPVVADLVRKHAPAIQTGDARVHVVVPARAISDDELRMVSIENSASDDGTTADVIAARWRLRSAMDALTGLGLDGVTGDVGDARPIDALEQALDAGEYDEVIVVTGPIGPAGWVHMDLPHRIERHVDLPVTHVEVDLVDR